MIHQFNVRDEWIEEGLSPFNEWIFSWNGRRPKKGKFLFYVRVKMEDWSPWLPYAEWGSEGQSSFSNEPKEAFVRVYQDTLEVVGGKRATGFCVKIESEGDGKIDQIHALHVYTNGEASLANVSHESCLIPIEGLSQMAIQHERHQDLCSPTSITAVIRHLSHDKKLDPAIIAERVRDRGFDIYGNWVLNVAEASSQLGPKWHCWVERLSGLDEIYPYIQRGTPVIVSVRGPLTGSAAPYAHGHLLAVIGYDRGEERVICMDPRFPQDSETRVSYPTSDFIDAWNRRGRIAYLFSQK